MTEAVQADTLSAVMEAHASTSFFCRMSTEGQDLWQALLSRMNYILKSIGLRSGEEGSHKSAAQNSGNMSLQNAWTSLAVWEGAPSCWKMTPPFGYSSCTHGTTCSDNMSR